MIAREEKGLLGVDYNRSPKTVLTTRKTNVPIDRNDPLPPTQASNQEDVQVTENPRDVTGIAPIYGYEPKTTVVGLQLELFIGIIMLHSVELAAQPGVHLPGIDSDEGWI